MTSLCGGLGAGAENQERTDGGDDTDPDLTRSSLFDPESDALLKVWGCRKVANVARPRGLAA